VRAEIDQDYFVGLSIILDNRDLVLFERHLQGLRILGCNIHDI
jgi:hypothetical protein